MIALGMDKDRAISYKQSSALAVSDLAFIFSNDVTFNMLVDIYGERKISLYFAALVQAGDIFLPETKPLGGEPEKCPVFDLYIYFAKDDKRIKKVYEECRKGIRMCGECKSEAYGLVSNFIEEHQAKRSAVMSEAQALLKNGDSLVLKRPV